MALQDSDIKWYYSGGASNSDPKLSFGGVKSSVEIISGDLANLFDHIFQQSRDAGATDGTTPGTFDQRVVYVQIDSGAVGNGVFGKLWMSANDSIAALGYELAIGALNTVVTAPANENTTPGGLSYVAAPTNQGSGIELPDVVANDYFAISIKRTINSTSSTQNSKGPTITVDWATL